MGLDKDIFELIILIFTLHINLNMRFSLSFNGEIRKLISHFTLLSGGISYVLIQFSYH